ncbi:MAG: hypothetical protein ABI051_07090 [Vicinamibacterales bacterium]
MRTSDRASAHTQTEQGYIMVALLIAMAVSAVWMGAALPAWRQQVVRENEAELIFRGEQYARAIYLYRQKNNQASPPTIDILVSQHYLRKKYKDPITGKEFLPLGGAGAVGGAGVAGLTGVRSTSNETSIVVYKNQQSYSQFPFDWAAEALKSGANAAGIGAGAGGRQGQPGVGRGGAATPPGIGGSNGGAGQRGGAGRGGAGTGTGPARGGPGTGAPGPPAGGVRGAAPGFGGAR